MFWLMNMYYGHNLMMTFLRPAYNMIKATPPTSELLKIRIQSDHNLKTGSLTLVTRDVVYSEEGKIYHQQSAK